jgi:hypothetical protein
MNKSNVIQLAAPKSSIPRLVPVAIGLAVLPAISPVISHAIQATAIILFELGHISSLAVQIFCN